MDALNSAWAACWSIFTEKKGLLVFVELMLDILLEWISEFICAMINNCLMAQCCVGCPA